MKKKSILTTIIILAVIAAVIAGICYSVYKKNSTQVVDVFPVSNVFTENYEDASTYYATVASGRAQDVPLRDGLITSIEVHEGDSVKEGDLLMVYDKASLDLSLDSDLARIALLRSQIDKAEREKIRYGSLIPSEYAPEGSEKTIDHGPLKTVSKIDAGDCSSDGLEFNCSLQTVITSEFLQKLRDKEYTVNLNLYEDDTMFGILTIDGTELPKKEDVYVPYDLHISADSKEKGGETSLTGRDGKKGTNALAIAVQNDQVISRGNDFAALQPDADKPCVPAAAQTGGSTVFSLASSKAFILKDNDSGSTDLNPNTDPTTPTPEPNTPSPEPDTPTPEPDTPTPEPDTPTPEPDTPTPEPDTPTPGPDTPTPGPDTPTPGPDTPTPGPDTPTPGPEPTEYPTPEPTVTPDPYPGKELYIRLEEDPLSTDWLLAEFISFNGDGADIDVHKTGDYFGTFSSMTPTYYERYETVYIDPEYDESSENYMYSREDLAKMIKEKDEEIVMLNLDLRAALVTYKQDLLISENGEVHATISGTVTKLNDPEKLASGDILMEIRGDENYRINVFVSEMELANVKEGDIVSGSTFETGTPFSAAVYEIGTQPVDGQSWGNGNPNASFYPVGATVMDKDLEMSVGEMCEVRFEEKESSASSSFLIPTMFIRNDERGSYVLRADNGVLKKEYVLTGKSLWGSYLEIKGGLTVNDYIAFPYGKAVREGSPVQIKESFYG